MQYVIFSLNLNINYYNLNININIINNNNKIMEQSPNSLNDNSLKKDLYQCICGKKYKQLSAYYKHGKICNMVIEQDKILKQNTCNEINNDDDDDDDEQIHENYSNKEIIDFLIAENIELKRENNELKQENDKTKTALVSVMSLIKCNENENAFEFDKLES